jgi:hypothetical protein
MTAEDTQPPDTNDLAAVAEFVRVAVPSLAESLDALAATVRRADGQHVDYGPRTAERRIAARKVADTAEEARDALDRLRDALSRVAEVWGGGDDR